METKSLSRERRNPHHSWQKNVEIHFREAEGIKIDTENKKVYCNTLGVVENCHFLKGLGAALILFCHLAPLKKKNHKQIIDKVLKMILCM
ncbi:hypothetical protein AAG906_021670 [Vitis piasezkii]